MRKFEAEVHDRVKSGRDVVFPYVSLPRLRVLAEIALGRPYRVVISYRLSPT